METAAKSWRLVVVLMVATVFTCLAPRAAAAEMEMAPSPSPDSGADDTPDVHLDKHADLRLRLRLLNLTQNELELEAGELVAFQKYMDQLEVSVGGKGFRFEKTVWDLSPKELGFKLGVVFAQAALQCNIITRVSGDPSQPPPQIPFFIRDKLKLSGIVTTPLP